MYNCSLQGLDSSTYYIKNRCIKLYIHILKYIVTIPCKVDRHDITYWCKCYWNNFKQEFKNDLDKRYGLYGTMGVHDCESV